MKRAAFDERDLAVYEAHSLAETDGGATTSEVVAAHDGWLPAQQLAGMARRGLPTHELDWSGYWVWKLTARGLTLAEQFRAARSAGEGEQS